MNLKEEKKVYITSLKGAYRKEAAEKIVLAAMFSAFDRKEMVLRPFERIVVGIGLTTKDLGVQNQLVFQPIQELSVEKGITVTALPLDLKSDIKPEDQELTFLLQNLNPHLVSITKETPISNLLVLG